MKRLITDVGLGVLLMALVLAGEFLITLPLPGDGGVIRTGAALWAALNLELGLAAVPAVASSVLLAWVTGTRTIGHGVRQGVIWTVVVGALYLWMGVTNDTTVMFTTVGLWVLLAAVFAGPVLAGWYRSRRTGVPVTTDSAPPARQARVR